MIEAIIYTTIIGSLLILARNIIASIQPKIKNNIKISNVSVGNNGELILTGRKKPITCVKYSIELPYDILISSGSLSSLSKKLAATSTLNPKITTFIVNTFIPVEGRFLYNRIQKAINYQDFFRGHVDEDLSMLLKKIQNEVFIAKYLILLCAEDPSEIDRQKQIIELEINNAIPRSRNHIFLKKEGFKSSNFIDDILSQEIPIKKNKIYDDFSVLLTPSLPSRGHHICIGKTREGTPYCLSWPKDFERHVGIIGPTGSGKTSLLSIIVRQLEEKPVKVYLVDPKGDLIEYLDIPLSSNASYVTIIDDLPSFTDSFLNGEENKESVLVIDEAWRVLGKLSGNEYSGISRLFRESRSRGLRIIYATQNPWDLPPTIYNNTGTLIIFSNKNITYVRGVSEITGLGFDMLSGFINTRTPFNSIVLRNGYTIPDQVRVFTPHWGRGENK